MATSTQSLSNRSATELALRWRLLISLALVAHLTAVIAAPMALPPSSVLQQDLAEAFRPYLNLLYLDHGYRFFAPAPGPSHLVRYELELPDGSKRSGTFPDKQEQWPRLFYHRHFMLTEKLFGVFSMFPPNLPAGLPAEVYEQRDKAVAAFDTVARSYAQHLLRQSGAKQVRLELVQHEIPFPEQVADGRSLYDERGYRKLWEKTYASDQP